MDMVKGFISILVATVLFFLTGGSSFADFYKYVDEDGVVHFTNMSPDTERKSSFKWFMSEKRKKPSLRGEITPYHLIINSAADRFGVETSLVKAIIRAESNFNPSAVSRVGAVGLMQLMPETARDLGVKDRYDPHDNVHGGVKYIKRLLTRFNGNVKLALAAYNAGETNVVHYGRIPPFAETQGFVKKVLKFQREYDFTGRN